MKKIFYSLQGEGMHAGRAVVFCRFAGCNLWSGREADRALATCRFCDTDFVGGETYPDAPSLVDAIEALWPRDCSTSPRAMVVLTGGEPALQVDAALVAGLRSRGFRVAIETNGTIPLPGGLDHVCVSPKAGTGLVVTSGDELKLVFLQPGAEPSSYRGLDFRRFYLQPMDGPDLDSHRFAAAQYCLDHPRWRLSLQLHKIVGLP